MDSQLKRRLCEEVTARASDDFICSGGAISAVLWILEDPLQYGVALLPVRGHESVDKAGLHEKTRRMLRDYVREHNLYCYSVKSALTDMDDILLRLGAILVDTRKNFE
jgi:hypothetical protein